MSDRAEFEKRNPVPEGAIWSEKKQGYYWSNYPTVAHPFNDDWEVWQEALEYARAQSGQGAEPVVDIGTQEREGFWQQPIDKYTQPAQQGSVPEGWRECLLEMVQAMHDYEMSVDEAAPYKHRAMMDRAHALLSATPQPEGDGWKPAHGMSDELPEIGKPVMGYHPDWVDDDFCADGIRECFLFGDGSEWQSARWDGYADQWIVEDGAPKFWQHHPQPPAQDGEV